MAEPETKSADPSGSNSEPKEKTEQAKSDPPTKQETPKDGAEKEHGPGEKPVYKRAAVVIPVSLVLLFAIIGGILYWLHARHFVSTDDAYIDGHVTQISPQVSAPVLALHVDDNQLVRKGDLLVELDPTDYQVALAQAQAQLSAAQGHLAQTQAQVGAAKATVTQAAAQIETAQVSLDNATRELQRYQAVDERARSRQQLDNITAAQKNAQAQLEDALAKRESAEANVTTAEAAVKASEGDVRTAEANLKKAEVNLSYCRIVAPSDGRVTQRTIEAGTLVQAGQAMFSLVSPDVWITANFKETQLKEMRPGQSVTIKIDAFPGSKFQGHVDSIQAGSGSRFSVLPAENATGNFVKIVQRVPVKIVFDHGPNRDDGHLLSPGLSVIPKVKVS